MRDAILAILLNNTDRFVSGQDMSRSLGITGCCLEVHKLLRMKVA